jgi:hypothetical protein
MLSTFTRVGAAVLAAGVLSLSLAADDPKPAGTDAKLVKLKDLIAAIQAHKGKIVVVDFWADF